MKPALTIAGSDCSGGAGFLAVIKAMIRKGVYGLGGMAALTERGGAGVGAIMA